MRSLSYIFYHLPRHFARCFRGRNLIWQLIAIAITYALTTSGFDWLYFSNTRAAGLDHFLFPAIIIGALMPIILPLILLVIGAFETGFQKEASSKKLSRLTLLATTLGQAALLGSIISSLYKAFTGRIQPSLSNTISDISRDFQFGFFRHGIFWGWPSSHTTIAFAMALSFIVIFPSLFPRASKFSIWITSGFALLYAFYIGIGVSVSIHWFSDFFAGALIGSVIGIVVGKGFRKLV